VLDVSSFSVTGESVPNALAFNDSASYSGGGTPTGPETITFSTPIHSASIRAGQSSGGTVTLTAFDGTTPVSSSFRTSAQELAALNVAAARITSLRLEYTGSATVWDDLTWGTAPVSANDAYGTAANTSLTVPAGGVLANDTDADGDTLTAALRRAPANGTVDLRADGSFTYTPRGGFSGPDSFDYRANDGTGNGNDATVTINVSPPPPPPPPPPTLLSSTISNSWLAFPRYTKVDSLAVNVLPAGSKVVVQCKTKKKKQQKKGCPYKKKTFKIAAARSRLSLLKPFRKKKIPVGSKLTITITAPGYIGKRFQYKMRKRRKPKLTRLCIPPGGKPGKCPKA
jgi:hypothetical protein